MGELTKDYDIYNANGSVNLTKLKKLKGNDVPRALAEINTFAPRYAGQLMIYQRKPLVDKLKLVNPEFKVKGKSDYVVAQAIVDAVTTNPAKCRACHISPDMFKTCKVIAERKITVSHTVALVVDDEGNGKVISLDDFNEPLSIFYRTNDEEIETDVVEEENVFGRKKKKPETVDKKAVLDELAKEVTVGVNLYFQLSDKVVYTTVESINDKKRTVALTYEGDAHDFRFSAINNAVAMQADLEDRWIEQNADAIDNEVTNNDDNNMEDEEMKKTNYAEMVKNATDDVLAMVCEELTGKKVKLTSRNRKATENKVLGFEEEDIAEAFKSAMEEDSDAEEDEELEDDSEEETASALADEDDFDEDEELEDDESDVEDQLGELSDEELGDVWFNCMGRKAKISKKNRAAMVARLIEAVDADVITEAIEGLESDEEDEDDEPDWDEVLEGVSANNLKAMCKKLKIPMAEIKGRGKSDLISIILDSDSEDIQKAYDAVGATSSEAEKEKEEKQSTGSGKYWETETPIESLTEGNIVNYYEEARKLQVYRRIEKNGEFIKSKGVTVDVDTMSSKDGLQMLSMMCYALKDAVEDERVAELVDQLEKINIEYNTEQYLFSETAELDGYDEATLKRMATNCGCASKLIKTANKKQLMKLIIDATQKLNG